MKLATSLMNFECQPCGIFEGFSYHQEYGAIDTTIFAATVGLGHRINNLVSSNFMGMVSSFSVIFTTGDTYSCCSNKGDFMNLEEKILPINIKVIAKGLEISGSGIVKYSIRSESGRMIALQDQAYYVPGLPNYLRIISPQGIYTLEVYKVTFIAHYHGDHDIYVDLNLKEDKTCWKKSEPVERVYIKYDPSNNLTTHEAILPDQRDKDIKALASTVYVTNKGSHNLNPSQTELLR